MTSAIRTLLGLAATLALAPAAHAAGKSDGKKPPSQAERRVSGAESYLPVFGLSTTLTRHAAPIGVLMTDAGLDVPDAALRKRASAMMPRVRDALRVALAEYASTFHRDGAAPDADQLVRLMQRGIDSALGQTGAKVLLANLMVQLR